MAAGQNQTIQLRAEDLDQKSIGSQKQGTQLVYLHALEQFERYIVKPHGQLVRVSLIHYCTSTSRLSKL